MLPLRSRFLPRIKLKTVQILDCNITNEKPLQFNFKQISDVLLYIIIKPRLLLVLTVSSDD